MTAFVWGVCAAIGAMGIRAGVIDRNWLLLTAGVVLVVGSVVLMAIEVWALS